MDLVEGFNRPGEEHSQGEAYVVPPEDCCHGGWAWPKRLRYQLLHVAARITRTARRTYLRIAERWPWARVLTAAYAPPRTIPGRLTPSPIPSTKDSEKPATVPELLPATHPTTSRSGSMEINTPLPPAY